LRPPIGPAINLHAQPTNHQAINLSMDLSTSSSPK
jgi:hypothetical protein